MKFKEIQKLSKGDKEKKLKELKMELVKSKVASSKGSGSSKTKQIKKIIARMLTLDSLDKKKISPSLENKNTKESNK